MRFPQPADRLNLTPAEEEERQRRLAGISGALLQERRQIKACLRCGSQDHIQWNCTENCPTILATSAQEKLSVKPNKWKRDEPSIKEASAPPNKKKQVAAILSMGGRIYKLECELMDVDD
jgi:hypothetical protein